MATVLLSHVDDDAAEAALVMARCRCQIMLVIVLPSHASDGTAKATWPRRDVGIE
jgi:hypothetical protein